MADPNTYINLVRQNSAFSTYAASRAGGSRLSTRQNVAGVQVNFPSSLTTPVGAPGAAYYVTQQQKAEAAKKAEEFYRSTQKKANLFGKKTPPPAKTTDNTPPDKSLGVNTPLDYKFNLPPHLWSLPLSPRKVDVEKPLALPPTLDNANFHGLRRGRMWFFNTNVVQTGWDKDTQTAQGSPTASGWGPDAAKAQAEYNEKYKESILNKDRKWGFQFMWNPDGFNVSVETNLQVTPSSADRLRTVAGAFPGMEYVNMQLVLDRTNDFACIRTAALDGVVIRDDRANRRYLGETWSDMEKYYTGNTFPGADELTVPMWQRIKDLAELGTVADLEYFFKMVNGSGVGGEPWRNMLKRETADIGFLQPSLLAMQLGPTDKSLSYVGWVNSLQITHLAFTQNMVPIRTQISFGLQCFAGSAITA